MLMEWYIEYGRKPMERRGSTIFGTLGRRPLWIGTWLPLEIFCSPTCATMVHSVEVKLFERNYGDLPENFDSSRPAFQLGH